MSSEANSNPNFNPHPDTIAAAAPVAESSHENKASGGLAAIVRKTLGEAATSAEGTTPADATSTGGEPPRGKRPRGGQGGGAGRGPRKAKPLGGDAPGDDGEQADDLPKVERIRSRHVEVPSKRAPLTADLEAEMAAAMGELSLDDVMKEGGVAKSAERIHNDSRHRAPVVKIHGDNVFFSLGGRNEGVASLRAFPTTPTEGEMFDVIVTGRSRDDGLYNLSVSGGAVVTGDWTDIREGSIVEAKITAANTGGLEAEVNKIRAFIPAGQISIFRVENLGEFVGQKMVCVVMEANERRGNLVLSRRAVLEREKAAAKEKLLAELGPGQTREGVVRKIQDFGAFVDLGGVDGLLHISQLSWDRIKHPSQVLAEGQKIQVRVVNIDPETGRIALAYRSEADHPWKDIETKFPVGTIAKGTVSRIADFGAFVKLAPGVEGLIHISELAHHKVYAVKNVVNEGQEVEVKILTIDEENQRMSLSLKATQAPPEKKEKEGSKPEAEAVEEPPRAPAVPKHQGPLKGGTKGKSGGEQFGLKW
jgi:small subunit ribosomal protein S1